VGGSHFDAGEFGGGNAGDVVAGGVAGLAFAGGVAAAGAAFGAGRSGPLMPQADTVATNAASTATPSARA